MKVFISGSISIKSLNKRNVAYIEQIIEGNCTVLIGDAYGIDKAVQEYLLQSGYPDVIVYFSGEKVRNNVGNWQVKQCLNPENLKGRSLYQLKDKAMADDCDCGLMFWDGKVKGLNTIWIIWRVLTNISLSCVMAFRLSIIYTIVVTCSYCKTNLPYA